MAVWKSTAHLTRHFGLHGREVRANSVDEYDASAQDTLAVGRYFSYHDEDSGEARVGCYDRATGRFVATTEADEIVTHFICPEWYVRGLLDSNFEDYEVCDGY